jgi:hypothetical protein
MLKSHCQPCGGRGALCHTTLPHGSVPLITRSRVPGQLHITVTVISRKIYFISVWLCVADCLSLAKNSRLPICSELHLSSSGAKHGRFCPCAQPPKIGHSPFPPPKWWDTLLTSLPKSMTYIERTRNLVAITNSYKGRRSPRTLYEIEKKRKRYIIKSLSLSY